MPVIKRVQVITFICIRAINTIKINLIFINFLHMSTISIRPARTKMYRDTPCFIYRFKLNLYPPKLLVLICNQIKRCMLSDRIQNCVTLLIHIELSLQNTQIALFFCVMHTTIVCQHLRMGQPTVSSGLPSALPVKVSPIQCGPLYGFRFPAKAPGCTSSDVRLKADALSS